MLVKFTVAEQHQETQIPALPQGFTEHLLPPAASASATQLVAKLPWSLVQADGPTGMGNTTLPQFVAPTSKHTAVKTNCGSKVFV